MKLVPTGIMIILACVELVSCGKHDNKDKSLWSQWKAQSGEFLDLSLGYLNSPNSIAYLTQDGMCYGEIVFIGNDNSGSFATEWDYPCQLNDTVGTYEKSSNTLTLCAQNECTKFK